MKPTRRHAHTIMSAVMAMGIATAMSPSADAAPPPPARNCPTFGWAEGLANNFMKPNSAFPTKDTANLSAPDCAFHQWSWEAFIWATTLITDQTGATVPRFMTLATPADLLKKDDDAGTPKARPLTLAARAQVFHDAPGFTEGAGAIVEADGNMLVAQNGYPVYASVHMNQSYFNTARKNLIATGGYASEPAESSFNVGDAVFKATWLRLDSGQAPPAGAYTTEAQVPKLENSVKPGQITIQPVPDKFETVKVALIGLHVVGYTENHPEFLWGTFELKMNSPQTPDNTFKPSSQSDRRDYTLYKGGTPFSQANIAAHPGANRPQLRLDPASQKLTPVTNVVLENQTGGENQPNGVGNIFAITSQAQGILAKLTSPQSTFASYSLDGTVWMAPNSYNLKSDQTSAVGSVTLANATAETFVQTAKNTPIKSVLNCFLCHNPTSYSFQQPPPAKLKDRLIALSHVLAVGSPYEVPNAISGQLLLRPDLFRR